MTMRRLLTRRPRWTVRLRLTLLYGFLVVVSAGAVAGSTYLLFDTWWSGGGVVATGLNVHQAQGAAGGAAKGPPAQAQLLERVPNEKARLKAADLHQLLIVSGIAM